jgi:hypothetical protein
MKKPLDPVRSFGGIVSNDIENFNGNKALMKSEGKHLKAYLQGKPWFVNGTKDGKGNLVKYQVKENWN